MKNLSFLEPYPSYIPLSTLLNTAFSLLQKQRYHTSTRTFVLLFLNFRKGPSPWISNSSTPLPIDTALNGCVLVYFLCSFSKLYTRNYTGSLKQKLKIKNSKTNFRHNFSEYPLAYKKIKAQAGLFAIT